MLQQLTAASDASWWAIASLCFFLAFFAVVVWYIWRRDKSEDEVASMVPFNEAPHTSANATTESGR